MKTYSPVIPNEQLGQVFRVLTERQDCDTQIFTRDIIVGVNDLLALHNTIREKVENLHEVTCTDSARIEFEGNRTKQYSSIEDFEEEKWQQAQPVSEVVLKWNILIGARDGVRPAEHNVMIRIGSGVKPQDFMRAAFSNNLEEMEALELASAGCACHITFANHSLATDIFGAVDQWVRGRPVAAFSAPYMQWVRKHSEGVARVIRKSIRITSILAVVAYLLYVSSDIDGSNPPTLDLLRNLVKQGACAYLVYIPILMLSGWLAGQFRRHIHKIGLIHPFSITAGDSNRHTEIAAKNKKRGVKLIAEATFAIVWNLAAGAIIWWLTRPSIPEV